MRSPTRLATLAVMVALAVPLAGPAPARAQAPAPGGAPDPSARLLDHLAGIDRSLREISVLLTSVLDHQQVNVLLNRLQLKERALTPLQQAVADTRGQLDSLDQEIKRLEMIREDWERRRAAAAPGEPALSSEEVEMRRLMGELERLEDRRAVLAQRLVEQENDLDRQRDDIRALEEMVDARLGLR